MAVVVGDLGRPGREAFLAERVRATGVRGSLVEWAANEFHGAVGVQVSHAQRTTVDRVELRDGVEVPTAGHTFVVVWKKGGKVAVTRAASVAAAEAFHVERPRWDYNEERRGRSTTRRSTSSIA